MKTLKTMLITILISLILMGCTAQQQANEKSSEQFNQLNHYLQTYVSQIKMILEKGTDPSYTGRQKGFLYIYRNDTQSHQ